MPDSIECEDIFHNSELWRGLNEIDNKLAEAVIQICKISKEYIDEIEELFPEYTSHGLDHINNILEKLEKIYSKSAW